MSQRIEPGVRKEGGGLEKTQKRAVGDTSRGGGQLKTFVTVGVRTIGSAVEGLNIADW